MKKHLPLWLSAASFVGVLFLGIYVVLSDRTSSKTLEPVSLQIEEVSSDIQTLERKLEETQDMGEWNEYEISDLEGELDRLKRKVSDLESDISYLEIGN